MDTAIRHPSFRKKLTSFIATAVALSTVAFTPLQAFAASEIWIDDGTGTSAQYTNAANGTGSGGGTWDWDGADSLTLDDYMGSEIMAKGDLDIDVSGDNVVTNDEPDSEGYCEGISVYDGDLSISGEGTLDVNAQAQIEGSAYTEGIYVYNGDVRIDGTTVNATATSESGSTAGIATDRGDVNIQNGANVTSTAEGTEYARGIIAWNGNVNISDSTVNAQGTTTSAGADALGNGIEAYGDDELGNLPAIASSINITNSNVTASGSTAGMLAYMETGVKNDVDADEASQDNMSLGGGKINIVNSVIKTPVGARVQDMVFENDWGYFTGQTIGTGTGTITDVSSSDIAKNVTIEKYVAPTGGNVAYALTVDGSVAPQTTDQSTQSISPLAMLMVAGIGVAGIGMALKRKKDAAAARMK